MRAIGNGVVVMAGLIAAVMSAAVAGGSARPIRDAAVLIEEDRIVAVGGRGILPPGIETIDLGPATVLPGFVDSHAHPLQSTDSYQIDHLRWSSANKALKGLKAVQDDLRAGWTTLRIAGDADVLYAHLDLRRAIDEDLLPGPRLTGAGHYISVTGGGGDMNSIAPEQHLLPDDLIVDGADAMRKAVREEIKYGSDWIKLLVTGAFMSVGDSPGDVHFSAEELKAAVEEAGRRRVPVMAHAHAAEGIKQAIRAGVRIGLGSDFGGFPANLNAREFGALVKAGMTPMQAIQAGTRVGAETLGWEDRIGTLEPGKLADLVVVKGDPLAGITELERVTFVMLGGRVVRNDAR